MRSRDPNACDGVMERMLDFRIASKIENIYPVEREILQQANQLGFDDNACFCLRLAMDEALINAIIHGNRNAEEKKIHIKALFNSESVAVTVQDEGDGFDRSQLCDPTEAPHLYETHGRGVFLIRQFTHELRFNDKGNEITFVVHQSHTPAALQNNPLAV